jgi:nucleoside-diphosphate-sugar epimerase
MNILLTGFTGALGPEIARQLAPHRILALVRDRERAPQQCGVALAEGSLESLPKAVAPEVEMVVHAAASTAFRASLEELRRTNVQGTARLLDFSRGCPRLRRFIHLSTTCVCGERTGLIAEAPVTEPVRFINAYEQSKWEAEQIVLASNLPVEIVRLSIVAGSERDGSVRRPGALHHTLYWLFKGLIPMMPGRNHSPVDLISTEFAAATLSALVKTEPQPGRIVHVSSGHEAPQLAELIAFLADLFGRHDRGWASGSVVPPDLVDAETFRLFEAAVHQSGDLLFQRVCADAQSFLPGLLHPRTFATSFVQGLAAPDWRLLAERVFTWLLANNWGRAQNGATIRARGPTGGQSFQAVLDVLVRRPGESRTGWKHCPPMASDASNPNRP